jgi:hypothetical protein
MVVPGLMCFRMPKCQPSYAFALLLGNSFPLRLLSFNSCYFG